MMQYPTVNDKADLEFLYTPHCKALPLPRNIRVPRLFYARILLFTAVFGHFFFASKHRESF